MKRLTVFLRLRTRRAVVFLRRSVNVGELHLNLAWLFYEWDQLEEVEIHSKQAQTLSQLSMFTPAMAFAHKISFYLHRARGEIKEAYVHLSKLDRLKSEIHPENLFQKRMIEGMAVELKLSLAALHPSFEYLLNDVYKWVSSRELRVEDTFDYSDEGSGYILARSLIAQDKGELAYTLLVRLAQAAETEGRTDDLIRALSLQALATQSPNQASGVLKRALTLAEAEGYIRTFVDYGPPMQRLLEQLAKHYSTPYISKLLLAFPETQDDYVSRPSAAPLSSQFNVAPEVDRLEPLNERERSVLRLLAVGNSHKQIAKELRLSPNTVRWYMQSLYSKLRVSNRTEAVNRARDAGLL
jgi:LuxR family transcriptional regulator, maltose regulon positive regulatory protein